MVYLACNAKQTKLTEIALETFMLSNPIETDKRRIPNCVKNRSKNGHVGEIE